MSLARDVTTVGSATLASRLLGFARDMGIAAVLGAGVLSDAFFAVLQIANLFRRLLAEGALNAAFVPCGCGSSRSRARAAPIASFSRCSAPCCSWSACWRRARSGSRRRSSACSRPASTGSAMHWQPTIFGSSRPMWRSPASSRSWPRRSTRRAAWSRRPRHRRLQRRAAARAGMDRRLRRDAAIRGRRDARVCDRARRDRAAAGTGAGFLRLRRSGADGAPDRRAAAKRLERRASYAAASTFPPTRGASSCSPFPAWSLPAFRN